MLFLLAGKYHFQYALSEGKFFWDQFVPDM